MEKALIQSEVKQTLKKKFKRYGACVGNNKVPYKVLSADDKQKCTNVSGSARTKK